MEKTFKTGGVPFCWHCGKQLMRKKDSFYFALVVDPAGHEHRVHKGCLRLVLGDGIRRDMPNAEVTDLRNIVCNSL